MGDDPLIGRRIDGRYCITQLVGRGGMGDVYAAEQLETGKRVAIKLISYTGGAAAIQRFRREARAASQVSHGHVVEILDVGNTVSLDYIVMEYLEGHDLNAELARGPLEPTRAIAIGKQMLAGLHAIHQAGIVHRDIKPANVFLTTRDGDRDYVKLTDFGIAKSLHDAEPLTGAGRAIGTLQFMAPEQLAGGTVDHRADIYAAGVTLFSMVTGAMPFETEETAAGVASQLAMSPRSPDEVNPDLPRPLIGAINCALRREPDRRYADALAFADALDAITEDTVRIEPGSEHHAAIVGAVRSDRRWPVAVMVAVLAGIAAGIAWWAL